MFYNLHDTLVKRHKTLIKQMSSALVDEGDYYFIKESAPMK